MFRFCFIGIAIFAVFNLNLAEEYETVESDGTQHLIPVSKPLQLIDPSSAKHFSILDLLTPKPLTSELISSNVENASAKTLTNSSCLTLVLADNLKEHITPDNLEPVTVLLQHSLETCPGLKSTFEILQKMMDIKGMSINEAIEFIQKLTIVQGDSEGQIEHETSDAISTPALEDAHVENSETSTSAPEIVTELTPEPETEPSTLEAEAENEETNVEPFEEFEVDNTNPLDVIQSVMSMLENDPQFATHLTESNEEDADNENAENESPIIHEPQH